MKHKQIFDKIKLRYKELFRKHPFLTGAFSCLVGLCGMVFVLDLLVLSVDILLTVMITIFHYLSVLGGFEDLFHVWAEGIGSDKEVEYFQATIDLYFEIFFLLSTLVGSLANFLSRLLVTYFPVLEELHVDLSWLLVDFSRIVRTAFNLIQFTLIFIFTRKIRRKIRGRFEGNKTDWSSIKCF